MLLQHFTTPFALDAERRKFSISPTIVQESGRIRGGGGGTRGQCAGGLAPATVYRGRIPRAVFWGRRYPGQCIVDRPAAAAACYHSDPVTAPPRSRRHSVSRSLATAAGGGRRSGGTRTCVHVQFDVGDFQLEPRVARRGQAAHHRDRERTDDLPAGRTDRGQGRSRSGRHGLWPQVNMAANGGKVRSHSANAPRCVR